MKVFKHKEHTAYQLSKRLVIFKQHKKTMFWHRGKIVKNHRFIVKPHRNWRYFHVFIRQPFLLFEKHNLGFRIGTPNMYLHIQTW